MDGMPGLIHSGDDFGMNDAGIVITETTISGFAGYDVKGVPEFVRARKAMHMGAPSTRSRRSSRMATTVAMPTIG